jgi:hypothetical protein
MPPVHHPAAPASTEQPAMSGNPPPSKPLPEPLAGPSQIPRSLSPQSRGPFRPGPRGGPEPAPRPPVRSPSWTAPSTVPSSVSQRTLHCFDTSADLQRSQTSFFHSRTPRAFQTSPAPETPSATTPAHKDRENSTPYRHRWPNYDTAATVWNASAASIDAPELPMRSQAPLSSRCVARSTSPFPYRRTPSHLRPGEEDGLYAHDPLGRPECKMPIRVPDADQLKPPSQRKRNATPGRRIDLDEFPEPQPTRPLSPPIIEPFTRSRSQPAIPMGNNLSVPTRDDSASPSGSDTGNGLSSDSGEEADPRPPSPPRPARPARHASFWR